MNVIAVDDELFSLNDLKEVLEVCIPQTEIMGFLKADEALEYARKNSVDIAFLDIKMNNMTGIQLAGQLTQINEKTNIVFVTGYSEYALEAFSVYASGYILKPATEKAVLNALSNLRYPVENARKTVSVKTFSNFEVYVDGVPLHFQELNQKNYLLILFIKMVQAVH